MAKKTAKKSPRKAPGTLSKLAEAVKSTSSPEVQPEAPQSTVTTLKPIGAIIVGGTKAKGAVTADPTSYAPVRAEDIKRAGTSRKEVIVGLAMNLMAGTVLEHAVMDKDGEAWAERSMRTDKMAFFKLVDMKVTGKASAEYFREAWAAEMATRDRYDLPTVQALWKAVRRYALSQGQVERKLSPMEKFARTLLDVLNNRTLSRDEQVRLLREAITPKAGYDAVTEPEKNTAPVRQIVNA